MLDNDKNVKEVLADQAKHFRQFIQIDPRVNLPGRPAVLDTPSAHAFSIGDEEFIAGTPATVAEQVVAQCKSRRRGSLRRDLQPRRRRRKN